jgi:hypothetical protein
MTLDTSNARQLQNTLVVGAAAGAQASAPNAAAPASTDCGTWEEGKSFYSYDYNTTVYPGDRDSCLTLCEQLPGCTGVSHVDDSCHLKRVPEGQKPIDSIAPDEASLLLCPDERNNQTFDGTVDPALAPIGVL